ncbi:Nucleotidyltransferase-like [Amphibacillus marinus]|uniref:Nucleotidyltransferase-like n=1 Tax=Amphibacillus marinus TaxID=872970 RepID=A0A1H8RM09_9BACI|nr:nucleotidyltransferase-like protein [Amphibacillus marinus]SEO66993.1 Nucleotidyltransferase-like [Amphibacillus marinus]
MEDLLRSIYHERASDERTLGILILEKQLNVSPITDNFDAILLVIVKEGEQPWFVKHYQFDERTAAMHIVEENKLHYWIDTSSYRRMVQWVIEGRVVFDRNEYIASLRNELDQFPDKKRELRLAIEFAKLTRSYREAKQLYDTKNYLDSYNKIISSLHSLGRLSIIEQGYHPELIVWNQIKRIDPAIYKLYDELMTTQEPLEASIHLMMLAIDFSISGKARSSSKHLLNVMVTGKESWSFGDLKVHSALEHYQLDLSMMLDYLIDKQIIGVELTETKGKNVFQRLYYVKV